MAQVINHLASFNLNDKTEILRLDVHTRPGDPEDLPD
jgi:hypothetical protein